MKEKISCFFCAPITFFGHRGQANGGLLTVELTLQLQGLSRMTAQLQYPMALAMRLEVWETFYLARAAF